MSDRDGIDKPNEPRGGGEERSSPRARPTRAQSILRRVGLLVMATTITLLTVEVGLRWLAAHAREVQHSSNAGSPQGERIILCVGDSHTYGAGVAPAESYPAQLQARLDATRPGAGLRVVNRGIPGINTGIALDRFEAQLIELEPEVVIVWVGVNNVWNAAGTEGDAELPWTTRASGWLLRSQLVRLLRVTWMDAASEVPAVDGRAAPIARSREESIETLRALKEANASPIPETEFTARIRDDLLELARISRVHGASIVFVTYPLHRHSAVNRAIIMTALEVGAPIVDTQQDYWRGRGRGASHGDLIVRAAGPHPSGLLYGHVVESMLPIVDALLPQEPGR